MTRNISQTKRKNDFFPCQLPHLQAYKQEKKIHVVSASKNISLTNFGHKFQSHHCPQEKYTFFLQARIIAALQEGSNLTPAKENLPAYFPGHTIPGPGGLQCQEIYRGNLLLAQFQHLLTYDRFSRERISGKKAKATYELEPVDGLPWAWTAVNQPALFFIKQISANEKTQEIDQTKEDQEIQKALAIINARLTADYEELKKHHFSNRQALSRFLSAIAEFWYASPVQAPERNYSEAALTLAQNLLRQEVAQINQANLMAFAFELEALASYAAIKEEPLFPEAKHLASGIFAGNYVEVFNWPLENFQATELVLCDRLLDEIINGFSRGFAPVIVNEYGLVADGNHRLTSTWLFNLLKFCQSENWCLDDSSFQSRVGQFFKECASHHGLLPFKKAPSPVTCQEILRHLQIFLTTPECRARLTSYLRPLAARHDYITELPAVLLPEYLGQAVIKASYDAGLKIERACPSLYEAMARNPHYVLPPRASYHFTDAALLPWFPVAKTALLPSPVAAPLSKPTKVTTTTTSSSSSSSGGSL